MKRFVPYLIAATAGFVLIIAYFIPLSEGWGEVCAIWFDILQAIAFILGGGNLLKVHLKKTSDKPRGWGYSVVVIVAFLTMLSVGLLKVGAPPAKEGEYYGQTWTTVPLASLPDSLTFSVEGTIPRSASGRRIHASARVQLSEREGRITFRGWMQGDQKARLLEYRDELAWQCSVERLFNASQPRGPLAGRVAYHVDHSALAFTGYMTDEHRDALMALDGDQLWNAAVDELYAASRTTSEVTVSELPPLFDADALPRDVTYDASASALRVMGPMTANQRDELRDLFPKARPMDAAARERLLDRLRATGPVAPEQVVALDGVLDGSWTVDQLHRVLDEAGKAQVVERTACELYEQQQAGAAAIGPEETVGEDQALDRDQVEALAAFAADEAMTVKALVARLREAGPFSDAQAVALGRFMSPLPTVAERARDLCFAMMRVEGPDGRRLTLTEAQRDLLLDGHREQVAWRQATGELFMSAHVAKFSWSGNYLGQGTPFWWLYEYMFKPLQATIFAMLAFYVASAAFRAFRAKNIEAIMLLGTAFIILLGRTFAGVFMTAWMPEAIAGLKIENLSVYIMQVFNTAGNRAIMIGIALGIASTSLKVLLGVDRSYLGTAEE